MPLERPSLETIRDRVKSDVKGGLGIKTVLRRSFVDVISKVIAGVSHVLHGFLEYISKQVFPDTAEQYYLNRWASIWGINRIPASTAQLIFSFSGDVGTIVPPGTSLLRPDGFIYTSTDEAVVPAPVVGVEHNRAVTTVADVSGSLDGTFWYLYSPTTSYYVWYTNGTAVDPNISGFTGIQVTFTDDDTADTIAELTRVAVDAIADFSATRLTNVVTIANEDVGAVEPSVNGASSPGFTFTINVTGTDDVAQLALVTANADEAGDIGNLDNGESVTLQSPIAGLSSTGTVSSTVVEGEDEEADDSLLSRLLNRIQQPPDGGNANDYVQTALAVPGITRAWVAPLWLGIGTVGVTFVEDNESNIIPDAAKVAEVETAIKEFAPVTAEPFVFAPATATLNLTIKITPNTQAVRDAVLEELKDLIYRDAAPKGFQKNVEETYEGTILKSRIDEAISIAQGEEDHLLVSPVADFTVGNGEMAVLGTVTFQPL